jgi:hypothetical protein
LLLGSSLRQNRRLTAVEVDQERSVQVPVPEEHGVDSRARGVVDHEIALLFVAAEKVHALLVDHQFLETEDVNSIRKLDFQLEYKKICVENKLETAFPLS